MAGEIWTTLIGLGCTVVSSIVTFMLTKRKYNTEVDSQQIKNMSDSFEVYKKIMHESLDVQNKKIEALQKENDALRNQFNQLQSQMINILTGNNLFELQKKMGILEPFDPSKQSNPV